MSLRGLMLGAVDGVWLRVSQAVGLWVAARAHSRLWPWLDSCGGEALMEARGAESERSSVLLPALWPLQA